MKIFVIISLLCIVLSAAAFDHRIFGNNNRPANEIGGQGEYGPGKYVEKLWRAAGDLCDNCPVTYNPDQTDGDANGVGDACDWICGDANSDNSVNVGDIVYLISYVFKGGPAPDPLPSADANGDGNIDVGDAVFLISFTFKGGSPPVCWYTGKRGVGGRRISTRYF